MKRQLIASFLLISALFLGCSRPDGGSSAGTAADQSPVPGDWIVVRLESDLDSLNQIISTSAVSSTVYQGVNYSMVGETWMQYDTKDWSFTKPLLAEAPPEISEDRTIYTFTLREGIKWHDGRPLTPDDFVFSAKAVMYPRIDSAALRSTVSDLTDVQIVEGRKVRYTLARPNVMNTFQLGTLPVVPKHVYDPNGVFDRYSIKDLIAPPAAADPALQKFAEEFNQHPANRDGAGGTGPYKFENWETGTELTLVRNPDYWGEPKPNIEKIVYRIIKENPPALTALKSGDIDFNPRLAPIQYAEQTSGGAFDSQFVKSTYTIPVYYYLVWNQQRPWFKDKRVRQAMTMLVNREQIIKTIRFGLARVATSTFNPSAPDFNANIQPWPYDPKRAAALLDEAGWKDTNGDGIRDKDGVPFRFEFLGSSASTFVDQLMPILKEEFRKVGIDMTERRLDFTVVTNTLKDQNFDAASGAWASDLVTDPHQLFHSSSAQNRGSNYMNYKNPEVDKLLEEARLEFDAAKRKQIYARFQEIVHDEQPYTFLFYPQEAGAYAKRFQGVEWLPARPGYDLRSWFVPKSLQKYTSIQP